MRFLKKFFKGLFIVLFFILVLYGIFYVLAWGNYKVAQTVEHDPSIPYIELNGVKMHLQSFGDPKDPVIIVVHGGPGNDFKYLLDLKLLADEYYVVFYDQRGTGLSQRIPGEMITLDNLVEDLHQIALRFGQNTSVNIIGHSWGGMLATAYLTKHPATINKLVLAEPGPLTPNIAQDFEAEMQLTLNWDLVLHLGKCYFKSLHVEEIDEQARGDYFFQTFAMDTTVHPHPMAGYFCNSDMRNAEFNYWRYSGTTSYEIMMKGMQGEKSAMNFIDGVENYQDKIMFLAGACNKLTGPEFQEEQRKFFPNTSLTIIEDAGHFMFSEQPEACAVAIRSFLKE